MSTERANVPINCAVICLVSLNCTHVLSVKIDLNNVDYITKIALASDKFFASLISIMYILNF